MKHPNSMINQDYIVRAVECERLAAAALTAESREALTYLATRWRDLAFKDQAKATHYKPVSQIVPHAGGLLMTADEIREEIAHLRSLVGLVGDMEVHTKIEGMILELERRLRELSNGGHSLTYAHQKQGEATNHRILDAAWL